VDDNTASAVAEPDVIEVIEVAEEQPIEDELLVEDISIDGMCGVY
jgi:mycofactocin precursor